MDNFLTKQLDNTIYSLTNNREFCIRYCMNCSSFLKLHSLIKDNCNFPNKGGEGVKGNGKKQVSSEYQLLYFLAFLGTEGDGLSSKKAKSQFPNGQGSFDNYCDRYINAILENGFLVTNDKCIQESDVFALDFSGGANLCLIE